ncbi:hypothetical protein FQR65_LT04912 [Abscondita terminalis]|nr:hypothetical protein FQR65_LT04912 [Abscondita terminalis]
MPVPLSRASIANPEDINESGNRRRQIYDEKRKQNESRQYEMLTRMLIKIEEGNQEREAKQEREQEKEEAKREKEKNKEERKREQEEWWKKTEDIMGLHLKKCDKAHKENKLETIEIYEKFEQNEEKIHLYEKNTNINENELNQGSEMNILEDDKLEI